jgi:hypothetical protein
MVKGGMKEPKGYKEGMMPQVFFVCFSAFIGPLKAASSLDRSILVAHQRIQANFAKTCWQFHMQTTVTSQTVSGYFWGEKSPGGIFCVAHCWPLYLVDIYGVPDAHLLFLMVAWFIVLCISFCSHSF